MKKKCDKMMIFLNRYFYMSNSTSANTNIKIPSDMTLKYAAQLSIKDDKPVMFDYWIPSNEKKAFVGVRGNKEKILLKSEDEYTSLIIKTFKGSDEEFILITENSIYIVSSKITQKKIE
jgi:hypothetical protein